MRVGYVEQSSPDSGPFIHELFISPVYHTVLKIGHRSFEVVIAETLALISQPLLYYRQLGF